MSESEAVQVPEELKRNVFLSGVEFLYNWSRRYSMWAITFGLACCAFEMIATAASRYDWARFGMDIMRPSPRQADLMIVAGTVTKKMLPQVVRIYDQMAEPKYVLAMGACAISGGPFKEGYNVVSGIDKYIPVDIYVPGCPPTPEALLHGVVTLRRRVMEQKLKEVPWYRKGEARVTPVPVLGPDLVDLRRVEEIAAAARTVSGEVIEEA